MNRWLQLLKTLGPTILSVAVPGLSPVIVPTIIHAIETAEASTGSSAEKKSNAIAVVNDAITVTNAVAKKDILDPQTTTQAVSSGIDAVVQGINAVHGATK